MNDELAEIPFCSSFIIQRSYFPFILPTAYCILHTIRYLRFRPKTLRKNEERTISHPRVKAVIDGMMIRRVLEGFKVPNESSSQETTALIEPAKPASIKTAPMIKP